MMNRFALAGTAFVLTSTLLLPLGGCGGKPDSADVGSEASVAEPTAAQVELPVRRVPHEGEAAEAYFSPDGTELIGNAKLEGDDAHHVYIVDIESGETRRINGEGEDACSHFYPDGERLIWTSTKDHPELGAGNYSDPADYPQGAELYSSAPDGSDVVRLTDNEYYEAEVSVSPDGQWILFTRQIDGRLDLWRMRVDGTGEEQITHTPEEQEGGSFYMPDSETVLFRSWMIADFFNDTATTEIYTIRHDGTDKRQITFEEGTNWAPYPAPDGKHFAFVKMLPPHNFEVFLMNMESGEQTRLTYDEGFDGFPSISPALGLGPAS
jgi:Tol biopolymer transport system component